MEFHLTKSKLRPWEMDDAEHLAKYANNKNIADCLRDGFPHPYTINDARNWLKNNLTNKNLLFAIEIKDEVVGGIGIIYQSDVYRRSVEIGYWLAEEFWNKGIMSEAIKTLVQHTFNNSDVVRIHAGIFESNTASARVLEKAGFKLEAIHKKAVFKKGKLMNELLYVIFK
jgi:RimJ/RimL family protein N-acetyltransferase